MASSIPAAKDALQAAISASPDLDGVAVIRTGDWTERVPESDRVIVEGAREIERDWTALGQLRLEETYTLVVSVEVIHRGADLTAAETRMWALVTAVERAVIADVKLGGAVRQCLPAGSPDGENIGPVGDHHAGATIDLHFECQQRIQLT